MNYLKLLPDDLLVYASKYAGLWFVIPKYMQSIYNKNLIYIMNTKFKISDMSWYYEINISIKNLENRKFEIDLNNKEGNNPSYFNTLKYEAYSDTMPYYEPIYRFECYKKKYIQYCLIIIKIFKQIKNKKNINKI